MCTVAVSVAAGLVLEWAGDDPTGVRFSWTVAGVGICVVGIWLLQRLRSRTSTTETERTKAGDRER